MIFSQYVVCSVSDEISPGIWIPCDNEEEIVKAREKFQRKFRGRTLQLLGRVSAENVNTWTVYTVLAYENFGSNNSAIWRYEVSDGHIRKILAELEDIDCELVVYEHVKEAHGQND